MTCPVRYRLVVNTLLYQHRDMGMSQIMEPDIEASFTGDFAEGMGH